MKRKFKKILGLLCLLVLILGIGFLLDQESERVVNQLYSDKDVNGIIRGLEPIAPHATEQNQAIVLIHGFSASPEVFKGIVQPLRELKAFDVYVPLLPYHGRSLKAFSKLDNRQVKDFLSHFLNKLSRQYDDVLVLAFSYAGTEMLSLMHDERLASNLRIVLLSPAVYLKSNDYLGKLKVYVYSLWRKYCNYPALGCAFPHYASGDVKAKHFIALEKTFRYLPMPAVLELFKADDESRRYIKQLQKPFEVIMAKDDDRVDYLSVQEDCYDNDCCKLHTFQSGGHILQQGFHQQDFIHLIIRLATQKKQACVEVKK